MIKNELLRKYTKKYTIFTFEKFVQLFKVFLWYTDPVTSSACSADDK